MEAALELANFLGVDLSSCPLDSYSNSGEISGAACLARLRSAQIKLLEMKIRLQEVQERASSAAVVNVEALQLSLGNVKKMASSLDQLCGQPEITRLVAQLQQPFVGNFLAAHPSHHSEVVSLVNGMVAEMANLQYALQSMRFVGDLLSTSGNPLLGLLQEIASYLAQCHQYYEALGLTQQKPPFSMSV